MKLTWLRPAQCHISEHIYIEHVATLFTARPTLNCTFGYNHTGRCINGIGRPLYVGAHGVFRADVTRQLHVVTAWKEETPRATSGMPTSFGSKALSREDCCYKRQGGSLLFTSR